MQGLFEAPEKEGHPVSAPRNATPTPHRGMPVAWPYAPHKPTPVDYVGQHRLVEGKTPAQFRVAFLQKQHQVVKSVKA